MLGPDADVVPCNGLAPLPISLVGLTREVKDKAGDGVLDAVPDRGVEFDHWAKKFGFQVVAWR